MRKVINKLVVISLCIMCLSACTGKRSAIDEAVPGNISTAVLVPQVSGIADALNGLLQKVSGTKAAEQLDSVKSNLKIQFGMDPTSRADYEQLGLDISASAAILGIKGSSLKQGSYVLVVPVKKEKVFAEKLALLVGRAKKGTATLSSETIGNRLFNILQIDQQPVAYYTFNKGYGYVFSDKTRLMDFADFFVAPERRNLKNLPKYQQLKEQVKPQGVFYLFNGEGGYIKQLAGVFDSAMLDFVTNPQGFELQGLLHSGKAASLALSNIFSQGTIGDGFDKVPQNAAFMAISNADFTLFNDKIGSMLQKYDFAGHGLEPLISGLLPQIKEPMVVTAALGDIGEVIRGIIASKRIKKEELLLDALLISFSCGLKDRNAALESLEKVREPMASILGESIDKQEKGDMVTYSQGEAAKIGWYLTGNSLVYAAGSGYMNQLVTNSFQSKDVIAAQAAAHEAGIANKHGIYFSLRFGTLANYLYSLAEGPLKEFLAPSKGNVSLPAALADLLSHLDSLNISLTTTASDNSAVHLSFIMNK